MHALHKQAYGLDKRIRIEQVVGGISAQTDFSVSATPSHLVTSPKTNISLVCTSTVKPILCLWKTPYGHIYTLSEGVFAESGRLRYLEQRFSSDNHCGLEIVGVELRDRGRWECEVGAVIHDDFRTKTDRINLDVKESSPRSLDSNLGPRPNPNQSNRRISTDDGNDEVDLPATQEVGDDVILNCSSDREVHLCRWKTPYLNTYIVGEGIYVETGRIAWKGSDPKFDCTIQISHLELRDSGTWVCEIGSSTNQNFQVQTKEFQIVIETPLKLSAPTALMQNANTDATLVCHANKPFDECLWTTPYGSTYSFKGSDSSHENGRISFFGFTETDCGIIVSNVGPQDNGGWQCQLHSKAGNFFQNATDVVPLFTDSSSSFPPSNAQPRAISDYDYADKQTPSPSPSSKSPFLPSTSSLPQSSPSYFGDDAIDYVGGDFDRVQASEAQRNPVTVQIIQIEDTLKEVPGIVRDIKRIGNKGEVRIDKVDPTPNPSTPPTSNADFDEDPVAGIHVFELSKMSSSGSTSPVMGATTGITVTANPLSVFEPTTSGLGVNPIELELLSRISGTRRDARPFKIDFIAEEPAPNNNPSSVVPQTTEKVLTTTADAPLPNPTRSRTTSRFVPVPTSTSNPSNPRNSNDMRRKEVIRIRGERRKTNLPSKDKEMEDQTLSQDEAAERENRLKEEAQKDVEEKERTANEVRRQKAEEEIKRRRSEERRRKQEEATKRAREEEEKKKKLEEEEQKRKDEELKKQREEEERKKLEDAEKKRKQKEEEERKQKEEKERKEKLAAERKLLEERRRALAEQRKKEDENRMAELENKRRLELQRIRQEEQKRREEAKRREELEKQKRLLADRKAREEAALAAEIERKKKEEELQKKKEEEARQARGEAAKRAEIERKRKEDLERRQKLEEERRSQEEIARKAALAQSRKEAHERQLAEQRRLEEENQKKLEEEKKRKLEEERRKQEQFRRVEAERRRKQEEERTARLEAQKRRDELERRRKVESEKRLREEEAKQKKLAEARLEEQRKQEEQELEKKRREEEIRRSLERIREEKRKTELEQRREEERLRKIKAQQEEIKRRKEEQEKLKEQQRLQQIQIQENLERKEEEEKQRTIDEEDKKRQKELDDTARKQQQEIDRQRKAELQKKIREEEARQRTESQRALDSTSLNSLNNANIRILDTIEGGRKKCVIDANPLHGNITCGSVQPEDGHYYVPDGGECVLFCKTGFVSRSFRQARCINGFMTRLECVRPDAMILIGGKSDTYGVLSSVELVTGRGVCRGAVPELPAMRWRAITSTLEKDKVITCGGVNIFGDPKSNCWILSFDPDPSWSVASPMNVARDAAAWAFEENALFVFGGSLGKLSGYTDSVEMYNINSGQWVEGPSMTSSRYSHCAVSLGNGSVIVTGGYGGLNLAERFDINTGAWTPLPQLNPIRAQHGCALVNFDGKEGVIVVGGDSGGTRLKDVRFLPLENPNEWKKLEDLNTARWGRPAVGVIGGRITVAAGWNGVKDLDTVEYYDERETKWKLTSSRLQTERRWPSSTPISLSVFPKCVQKRQ
ncbi:hypothetical protein TCAL_02278 [Tigriopus californicus]|uniref:Ig-like domain-containing protein n=1 Tax=Tigriopus californicus TaxID=6832 RepID=A0A553NQU7_TIGCA|nr:hypothetical protein TCAL_02278 [Tigriopus californicus]|eukprot:TCALIF_02278-PA protein Name:"Similar to F23F12.8 Uncharacterized protein F23F12.8 (Caenorhabditis elegans)" AED:0.07 eAED:0.07 QI:0/0.8/0.66/0.83/1/1/6/383/1556